MTADGRRLRIVFSVLTPASLRNYESVVRLLAACGHSVHLAIHTKAAEDDPLNERLARELPSVTTDRAPTPKAERWQSLAIWMRSCRDYLQFLDPIFNASYRARAEERVPGPFRRVMAHPVTRRPWARRAIEATLALIGLAIPTSPTIEGYLSSHAPDVLMLTPFVALRAIQPDYLAAAQALGIRSVICVHSWDNLSSKSLIAPLPDLITVWNETQREEAVQLHHADPDRVAVTGAQCYDHWFERAPSDRERFLTELGLDPERDLILYTCFSPFKGAASEAEFVTGWIERLRAHDDERLAGAGLLIRPHPKRRAQWQDVDLTRFENVAVHPLEGPFVADAEAMDEYFDSIFHSRAVVGLNTSAMIEAGIVGRPVLTVLAPEFEESQAGTFHFHYLVDVGGGLVRVAGDFDEHFTQLGEALRSDDDGPAASFVERFVRPGGLDHAATELFVEEIERLAAAQPPRAVRAPIWSWPLRPLLWLAAGRLDAVHLARRRGSTSR